MVLADLILLVALNYGIMILRVHYLRKKKLSTEKNALAIERKVNR